MITLELPEGVAPEALVPMPGRIIVELKDWTTFNAGTSHGLALPSRSERKTSQRETTGTVVAVAEDVSSVEPGDMVWFRRFRPELGQTGERDGGGARSFTQGDRRFEEIAFNNCYAARKGAA